MNRMSVARKRYSLAQLLDAQIGAVKKHPAFPELSRLLRESPALRRARLNRRAYRLLNEPRLEKRNLGNFYSTYRVLKSPFFELFLSIKWEYLAGRAARQTDRETYIATVMAECPRAILGMFDYLAEMERTRNPRIPLWKRDLFPRTKKRAREMAVFTMPDWLPFISGYIDALGRKYTRLRLLGTERLLAYMLLECLPNPKTGEPPTDAAIKAGYRTLSKEYHPDAGGETRRFLLVKKARDTLLG